MKLKLYRDKVISVVKGRDLVGVYARLKPKDYALYTENKTIGEKYGYCIDLKYPCCVMLGEFSPSKADKIIKLWNSN
jgi:hypothetical protein